MTEEHRNAIRAALGNYVQSEGCTCCEDQEAHAKAAKQLAELLEVPAYADGSGYDFYSFATEEF